MCFGGIQTDIFSLGRKTLKFCLNCQNSRQEEEKKKRKKKGWEGGGWWERKPVYTNLDLCQASESVLCRCVNIRAVRKRHTKYKT